MSRKIIPITRVCGHVEAFMLPWSPSIHKASKRRESGRLCRECYFAKKAEDTARTATSKKDEIPAP